jgi:hypothetical protein
MPARLKPASNINPGRWIGFEAYDGYFLFFDFNGDNLLCVFF